MATESPVASSSTPRPARFDASQLDAVNAQLQDATPQEILTWAIDHLPRLYQTTAFGLTGLAATDMIARITKLRSAPEHLVPMIFIDTLYHFDETLALVDRVERKYDLKVNVYKPPAVSNVDEFEAMYGKQLWDTDEETYDYLVKVEPARRAYDELDVKAVITGRRATQGGDRSSLKPLEIDETGLVKVNPLFRWSFKDVKAYIDAHDVPYNPLLDLGYKSVGDWHSTAIPLDGQDERAGRWAGNKAKTECGLHKDYFKMKKAFEKKRREAALAEADKARGDDDVGQSTVQLGLLDLNNAEADLLPEQRQPQNAQKTKVEV